jgi:Ankyrin repeats (3 copies)
MPRNSDDVLIELPGDGVLGELPGNDACGEVNESDEGDEAGHVVEPLQLYIEAKVRKISDELDYSQSLRTSVERAFRDSGDGTFLWVDLAIEELKKAKSQRELQELLAHLPVGLDEMYYRTLCQVPPHLVLLVAAILRWVIAARRPLTLHELSIALNLANCSHDPTRFLKQGIEACGYIVAITDDETVNILHNSAKDFLIGKSSQLSNKPELSPFRVDIEEADREIAHFCLAYLEQGCLRDGPVSYHEHKDNYIRRVNQFPFLPYAALYWPEHLRSAAQPFASLSSPFFISKSRTRRDWWQTYWTMTTSKGILLVPRKFTLLHLAAYFDLLSLAKHLLQRGELFPRLDQRDTHGFSALEYAVELGNMSVFLFLLQQGASQECIGSSLLEEACRKGQKEVAEHLLTIGYDVNGFTPPLNAVALVGIATRWLPGALSEGLYLDTDKLNLFWVSVYAPADLVGAPEGSTPTKNLIGTG